MLIIINLFLILYLFFFNLIFHYLKRNFKNYHYYFRNITHDITQKKKKKYETYLHIFIQALFLSNQ